MNNENTNNNENLNGIDLHLSIFGISFALGFD